LENYNVMVEIGEDYEGAVEAEELAAAARAALIAEGLSGQTIGLSIEIAGDEEVQRLNREYRGVDRTTDVLSFANEEAPDWEGRPDVMYSFGDTAHDAEDEDYDDEDDDDTENASEPPRFVMPPAMQGTGERYLGDIIISYPQAERQCAEFGNTPLREIQELVIHGVFHLLGYDHEADADREIMRQKEEAAAQQLDGATSA
jgi:probable rRNA maturation factor